ncbi:MAG TPA: MarR family winged helix-turn-helix transcriptional regulator, partial [Acidisoma sp.]|nr:MarR family winged helix-turn-helix transcriptional regulator [Acidisoma sp.]
MHTAAASLRRFNRFFTLFVGALDPKFLGTDMSLAEARLLLEIVQRERPLAAELQAALAMDGGFVSRVLSRFERRGWIERARGAEDGRQRPIAITAVGRQFFAELDRHQQAAVEASLDRLRPAQRVQLTQALRTAQSLLDPAAERQFTLRTFRAG